MPLKYNKLEINTVMRKTILLLAITLCASITLLAQSRPAYKITYSTIDEDNEVNMGISHEIYVNKHKIKINMPSVFPNRTFYANKEEDSAWLSYPSLSQYVLYNTVDEELPVLQFYPGETKVIAGYKCKLAQIEIDNSDEDAEKSTIDIWYTEELPSVYWSNFEELRAVPGAALEIIVPTGLRMVAQKVSASALDDHDFEIPTHYQEIDDDEKPIDKDAQVGENIFLFQDDKTGLYGLQDDKQHILIAAKYLDFSPFQNGTSVVLNANEKFGVIDTKGTLIIPFQYDYIMNGYTADQFMVGNDEKYGLLDQQGKIIIPIEYDYISFLQGGYAIFSAKDKYGILNAKNEIVIPAMYPLIVSNNSSHFISIGKNNEYSLVDMKTNKIVAKNYDYISITEEDNLFLVQKKEKFGFIDSKGKVVIPIIYANASLFEDGLSYVVTENDEVIIINTKGEKVGDLEYATDEYEEEID